jgi:hypothetical protein
VGEPAALTVSRVSASIVTVVAGFLCVVAPAGAYTFTDPTVQPVGNLVNAFDWSSMNCEQVDIPDAPARAFRDPSGQVVLFSSHNVTRRAVGPALDNVQHQCPVTMGSTKSADPAMFADLEWISSPYILPDGRVFSLVHNEYQGAQHSGQCPSGDYFKCWFNSITLAVSTNRGATFTHAAPSPNNMVATIPYRYTADAGPAGVMLPSNIIKSGADGLYYAMIATQQYGAQQKGVCVMRTADITNPSSWRAWDGSGYNVRFANPYVDGSAPETHVCTPVAFNEIGMMSNSLTYSTYLNKWVLVGASRYELPESTVIENPGFYWSTSTDLIHWSRARQLVSAEVLWSHKCGDDDPLLYPSLLDPTSPSRNFETIGRRPYLFFTQLNYGYNSGGCWMAWDRDMKRVALEFNKAPDCSKMVATPSYLPSMTRGLVPVTLSGATEPDGEAMSLKITAVSQNQPVTGRGDSTSPDAIRLTAPNQVLLRAEYGVGGGRVYRISVRVTDSKNISCNTTVKVPIPRNATDSSASYGSFQVVK